MGKLLTQRYLTLGYQLPTSLSFLSDFSETDSLDCFEGYAVDSTAFTLVGELLWEGDSSFSDFVY
jgi:hypothetical protein